MALSAGDFLWNKESFVSMNCDCNLALSDSGNLVLYSFRSGSWRTDWESGTAIFDYSGESVSKMEWDAEDTVLVLNEYVYRGVPAIRPIRLWTANLTVAATTLDASLVLSNDCCLEVVDTNDTSTVYWSVCEAYQPTGQPTENEVVVTEVTTDSTSTGDEANNGMYSLLH